MYSAAGVSGRGVCLNGLSFLYRAGELFQGYVLLTWPRSGRVKVKSFLRILSFGAVCALLTAFFSNGVLAGKTRKGSNPLASVVFLTSKKVNHQEALSPVAFKGIGPGFVIDRQGHIAVQVSVISDIHSIECSVTGLGYWPAVLLGQDSETGIGVLRIKAPEKVLKRLRPVKFSKSARLSLGQEIVAGGISPDGRITVFKGICSVPRRSLRFGQKVLYDLVQTDIFVNEGLNGAPFFDKSGRLVGMGIMTTVHLPPNVGFAIPAGQLQWIINQIIENGEVKRAWFGASFISVDSSLSGLLDLPAEKGVLLVRVEKGSPAERAGFHGCDRTLRLGNRVYPLDGDFIVAVDRTPVTSDSSFVDILNRKGPGKEVLVSFYRGKRLKRLRVKLGGNGK